MTYAICDSVNAECKRAVSEKELEEETGRRLLVEFYVIAGLGFTAVRLEPCCVPKVLRHFKHVAPRLVRFSLLQTSVYRTR